MSEFKSIPTADSLFDGKTRMLARYTDSTSWCAFNPSITYTDKYGYIVLFRSANGFLEDHRPEWRTAQGEELSGPDSYETPGEWQASAKLLALWNGVPQYRNRMFLGKLDARKLTVGSLHEVDLSQSESAAPVPITRGLEDGRIYDDGESLRISAVAYEKTHIPCARICSVQLHVPSLDKAYTTGFDLFDSPKGSAAVEKNWMPVEKGMIPAGSESFSRPEFDYIYESGKTYTIATRSVDEVGGFVVPVRGGSQLIPLDDGTFIAVVHETVTNEHMRFPSLTRSPLMRRRYAHRFVQYSDKGQVLQVTDRFNFLNKSIEFASGLARYGDRLLVTFGALDSSAHICSVSLDDVLAALRRPRTSA